MRESLKYSGVNVWNDCSTTSNNCGQTVVREMARSDEIAEFLSDSGEPGGNRTPNPQIKSLLLCQLSYRPALRAPCPCRGGPCSDKP